jgi:anti-sigma B factor antagonist
LQGELQISERRDGPTSVLELTGEVDAYTSPSFREAMISALGTGRKDLIISMERVEYIDSSGLGALVGGLKRASEQHGRILIVCSKPQVTRVFEITGLVRVFPIFESVEAACAALEGPSVSEVVQ